MKLICALFVTLFITQSGAPRQVADELLAADRAFASASATMELVPGISAMFAPDIVMIAPTGLVSGAQNAIDTLKSNPANARAKAVWTPARVGVSSDGTHGFTAGYMTLTRSDGASTPVKYLAYWEKQKDGWRVVVYKRQGTKVLPPASEPTYLLPAQMTTRTDASAVERHRESLAEAERSFSNDAQVMGLGPAFKKYGSADALNLGGPDALTFVMGNDAISQIVRDGAALNTSPVKWGPDKTIIAPSGDFGVTIGYITRNQPGPDGKVPPPSPFFTIWQRASLSSPWRYIAE